MKITVTILIFFLLHYSLYSQGIIESNNKIAFKVYKQLNQTEQNIVFSPFSISSAVAMTYIGARNSTFNEISNTFYFNKNIKEFSESYKNYFGFKINPKSAVQFYNANSLWIQQGLILESDFIRLNKEYFSASLNFVDFTADPDNSRILINSWVEKNTNNKISDLLKPSSIDEATQLILVNALYFNGTWKSKFIKEKNTKADFQVAKRYFVQTEYMNRSINTWYFENKYFQIVDLPYENDEYALMIILPKSYRKLKKVEKTLSNEFYNSYISNKEKRRVNLSLPKFQIDSEFDLNKTLFDLGIKEAFTGAANFSGISEEEKLYISKVVQKATISIDEEGTEAAAATAISMRKTSVLLKNADLKINRPFIYIIRNTYNNCIYFIGKVSNPKE
ncbi:MAG: hypothetical protein C0597_08825 [Marinilabiliales bacterium]|nr:MAG: hypothetical protein C0597_08825 [Marinilabiliales bacterium]